MSNKTDTGKLGLIACITMLAGGCIGSSIFSLSGMTMYYAGPAAILSWIIAAAICGCYGLQAAELSKEDVQTFLDTGMESDADTSAHKLAQKLQQKVDAGGTVTQEELARQYQANILAVEEETARLQKQAREQQEKAGNNETSTLVRDQQIVNEEQRTGGIQNGTNENQWY